MIVSEAIISSFFFFFFFQAEDGIRDYKVTGVQTCALPICGDDPAPIGAIDLFHGLRCVRGHSSIIFICASGCRSGRSPFDIPMEPHKMKYMLLIYTDEKSWTEAERQDCYAEPTQFAHQLQANGRFLATAPLLPVAAATR